VRRRSGGSLSGLSDGRAAKSSLKSPRSPANMQETVRRRSGGSLSGTPEFVAYVGHRPHDAVADLRCRPKYLISAPSAGTRREPGRVAEIFSETPSPQNYDRLAVRSVAVGCAQHEKKRDDYTASCVISENPRHLIALTSEGEDHQTDEIPYHRGRNFCRGD
jgi:hypothetical protein